MELCCGVSALCSPTCLAKLANAFLKLVYKCQNVCADRNELVTPPNLAKFHFVQRADSPPHFGKALKLASEFHSERTKLKP